MVTSYLVATALVKLFVEIMSLKTRLNNLIGNIWIDFDVNTWDFYVFPHFPISLSSDLKELKIGHKWKWGVWTTPVPSVAMPLVYMNSL